MKHFSNEIVCYHLVILHNLLSFIFNVEIINAEFY